MLARPSFFADIVQPSASENISRAMSFGERCDCPCLARLDETRVLGEAARVEKQRLSIPGAERPDATQVRERHRLPAAGVVRDGDHHQWHAIRLPGQQPVERLQVDVALERVLEVRHASLRDDQVPGLGALDLDVGARRVEMVVVRHDIARMQDRVEQDPLSGSSLVSRNDVRESGEVLDDRFEAIERPAPRIGLVGLHQSAPLRRRHGPGSGIGQQVDQHVLGLQPEHVVAGLLQRRGAILPARELERLRRT